MQPAFLRDIVERLEAAGATYAITGSIASNYWGIPRTTHDVDILLMLPADQIGRLVQVLSRPGYYLSEPAVREAAQAGSMFNVIDTSSGHKADFWIFTGDPFSQSVLGRRRREEILKNFPASLASPEDVLLHKLVWHQITPSERQLADAAGIAAVQAGRLDLAYLKRWAARQGTNDLLEEVLQGKYLKRT